MTPPEPTRPHFPDGYMLDDPERFVPWEMVERRLGDAKNYWLCTVRPNGRPHSVPVWGVWVEGHLYYDGSPETRHARNTAENPNVAIHLEDGDAALILAGVVVVLEAPPPPLAEQVAAEYRRKYGELGYAPEATQWDEGGLFQVRPRQILTWTVFNEDPTKYKFESNV